MLPVSACIECTRPAVLGGELAFIFLFADWHAVKQRGCYPATDISWFVALVLHSSLAVIGQLLCC